MILGLDTSTGQCAAALVGMDGTVLARRVERMQRGHAEALFPLIEAVLDEAGAGYADLRGIRVCTGPGSFTGIRVGVAAARGLALGLGLTAIGVDRFRALVRSRRLPGHAAGGEAMEFRVAVALAGPQGTAYFRTLDGNGAPCGPAGEARRIAADALESAAPGDFLRLGDAWPGATEEDGLPDPAAIASDSAASRDALPAKPFYLRDAGAAPPREAPPPLLDP